MTRRVVTLDSGMVRSDPEGRPDYTLIYLPLLERWAQHMAANIESKGRDNWRKASTPADRHRFEASAWRHFVAWYRGDTDEDHAAALLFNIAGVEYVKARQVVE